MSLGEKQGMYEPSLIGGFKDMDPWETVVKQLRMESLLEDWPETPRDPWPTTTLALKNYRWWKREKEMGSGSLTHYQEMREAEVR